MRTRISRDKSHHYLNIAYKLQFLKHCKQNRTAALFSVYTFTSPKRNVSDHRGRGDR
jgi:hypothetical protein